MNPLTRLPALAPLAAALLTLLPQASLACRYSVRDTGFVDLGADPYRLILETSPSTPARIRSDFEQAAAAVLLDANIRFSSQPAPADTPTRLAIHSPDGRQLTLAEGNPDASSRADIVDILERTASSPFRSRLLDDTLRAYAVIILVEGGNADANRRARITIDEAIAAITRILPSLPKPVDTPPRLLTIPTSAIAAESVLVWGLGMQPTPTSDPRVAIVFGRGRRVGDPLEGGLITRTTLQDRLAIIGQDCECDLDRSSLQGPVIPSRWDTPRQSTAAQTLGFDPENPLIRAEISRIVIKGPAKPGAKKTVSGAFDSLALGYSEEPVDAPTTLTETDPIPDVASASATAATTDTDTAATRAAPTPGPTRADAPSEARSPRPALATAALWFTLSGSSLAIAACGVWLLVRSRKDRP